jgi:hypothetical protein
VPLSSLALALVLMQAAAATPSPAPTPTPRPAAAGPRTLQDVARERKLSGAAKGKGSLGTISVGPSTGSPAPSSASEPGATPEAGVEPSPVPTQTPSSASVRVTTVANDGIVDSTGGVRVNGTVRNSGSNPACNVVVTVRIMDSHGDYLSSAQASPDTALVQPGEVVSFRTIVQAPPGVRGARSERDRKDVTEGSSTYAGEWKVLGGTEASVVSATEDCPR